MALGMRRVARLGNLHWGICLRIKLKNPVSGWLRKSYHGVLFLLKAEVRSSAWNQKEE